MAAGRPRRRGDQVLRSYTPVLSEVWDAYWVGARQERVPTGEQHNMVSTADVVRGVDVLRMDLPKSVWVWLRSHCPVLCRRAGSP